MFRKGRGVMDILNKKDASEVKRSLFDVRSSGRINI